MYIKLTMKDADNADKSIYVNMDKIRSFIADKEGGTRMYDDTEDPYYVEESPAYIWGMLNKGGQL